jgi:hypothetical protein
MSGEPDLLSDAAVAKTRAHPEFLTTARAMAAAGLAAYAQDDATTRWMFRDLGRSALYLTALGLDALPGSTLTAAKLAATGGAVASRGRALAFVDFALGSGRMVLASGAESWVHRPIALMPAFVEPFRRRTEARYRSLTPVAPEVAGVLAHLAHPNGISAVILATAMILAGDARLSEVRDEPFRRIFLARDVGARVIESFIVAQAPNTPRLIPSATVNRLALSRSLGVSRAHLNRMLGAAEAAGAARLESSACIVFADAFSDEVERYYAGQVQFARLVARLLSVIPPTPE